MNCQVCLKALRSDGDCHAKCLREFFGTAKVETMLGFTRADVKLQMLERSTSRMSISGVQPKLSMIVADGQLVPVAVGGRYILKPSPEGYEHAAENEHLSMHIGAAFGLDVAACMLVRFADGELAYLVRRFDREADGTAIHQEDLAQALGRDRDRKGRYKYEGSYQEAAACIYAATQATAVVYDFFRRLLVRYLVHDGDFHLKNTSLWKPAPIGIYQGLTPNYDILNTRLHLPHETVFALDLFADGEFTDSYMACGHYSWPDFLEFAKRVDLSHRAAERVRRDLLARAPAALALIERSFLPAKAQQRYHQMLTERLATIA